MYPMASALVLTPEQTLKVTLDKPQPRSPRRITEVEINIDPEVGREWATEMEATAEEWKEELKQWRKEFEQELRQQKEELVDGFLRDLVVQLPLGSRSASRRQKATYALDWLRRRPYCVLAMTLVITPTLGEAQGNPQWGAPNNANPLDYTPVCTEYGWHIGWYNAVYVGHVMSHLHANPLGRFLGPIVANWVVCG